MSIIIKRTVHAPHLKSKTDVRKSFGLGDAVAAVAKPIAAVIDSALGTNIKNCGGCAKRQEALNQAVPSINPFSSPDVDTSKKE